MKSIKSLLTLSAALLAMAVSASAIVSTDTNTHNVLVEEGQSVNGQWSYGPIAAGQTVVGVETWFKFSSTDGNWEEVRIELGTGEGGTDYAANSGFFNFGSNYTVNWNFNSGSILADAANGFLSYEVSATSSRQYSNDFTFEWAKVNVTTKGVPEGGTTLAMIGLTFLGFAGIQRKFRLVR